MEKKLKPETLAVSYGYKPQLSEGALKCPIFQTSTFVFKTAEDGKAFFEVAYGHRKKKPFEELGLIYSRINNPDLEILENRLTVWDEAEDAAVFESGLAAITTILLEFLKPGDKILHSSPVYGGTDHFIKHVLPSFNITNIEFGPNHSKEFIIEKIMREGIPALIFVETPANPTNSLIDLEMCREIADMFSTPEKKIYVAVDNTYLGPLWQHPLKHGADMVVYSATKYIGGHSDLIAGACLGSSEVISRIKTMRTFLGNMAGPWTGWLLLRSLETLRARMEVQAANAVKVAQFLCDHSKVSKVYYLGTLKEGDPQYTIYKKQCLSPGAMVSFDICGGEKEAFKFLNNLKIFKLAVSLGGTQSLAEHPAAMTHTDVSEEDRKTMNITDKLIRLSIGVENSEDLVWDLDQALEFVC